MQPVISLKPHLVSITRSQKLANRDFTLFLEFAGLRLPPPCMRVFVA